MDPSEELFKVKKDWTAVTEAEPAKFGHIGLEPDTDTTPLHDLRHDHYFVRKNDREFGCRDCDNRWEDDGGFQFQDGQFISYDGLATPIS